MMADSWVSLVLKRRPLWQRVLRFPFTCRRNYKIMRSHQTSRIVALYGAWLLAGLTLKTK
jgi:hypothetical protein